MSLNPMLWLQKWWKLRPQSKISQTSMAAVGISATAAVIFELAKSNWYAAGLLIVGGIFATIGTRVAIEAVGAAPGPLAKLVFIVIGMLLIGVMVLLFTSIFFNWPLPLKPVGNYQQKENGGISIEAFESFLGHTLAGTNAPRLARAMARDALQLASDRLPITGNEISTGKLVLSNVDLLFLQSSNSIVKIEAFALPANARVVRGQSHKRYDDGDDFMAISWAFIWDGEQLQPCQHDEINHKWEIPQSYEQKGKLVPVFVLIAFYSNTHFFDDGKADVLGIEIDDLAGRVDFCNVGVAGHYKTFNFGPVFRFPPTSPLQLFEIPSSQIVSDKSRLATIRRPADEVLRSFEKSFVPLLPQSGADRRSAQKIIDVWKCCSAEKITSDVISIQNVSNDLQVLVYGEFGDPRAVLH